MGKRKATIWSIIQSKEILDKLVTQQLPAGITFDLFEVVETVDEQLSNYQKTLDRVLGKHKNGKEVLENPEKDTQTYNKIVKELEPVLNKEIEFNNINIKKEDLVNDNMKFSVQDLLKVRWLFTEV